MASLLYKLGLFSARRAWVVLVAWILLLGVAATLALTNGGKLTTSISINGVPAQVVIDQLKKNFPEASRGSGQAVLQKADGSKFNNADIAAITAALEDVEKLEGISGTLNPFTIQSEIEDRRQEAKDGEADLVQAEKDLVSGQAEIVTCLLYTSDAADE